LHWGGLLADR
jgi:hypothetical protein